MTLPTDFNAPHFWEDSHCATIHRLTLAPSFEAFVRGLQPESAFDE